MTQPPESPSDAPDPAAFDAAAYLDAASALVGVPVAEADRAGVIANLEVLAGVAAELMAQPLPDDLELAPVFTA